jgi:serine/threonine protein kinase
VTILQFSGAYAPDPLEAKLARALGEHYVVERELGGSGMSRVFLVTDTRLQRRVAVKVLAPELAATVSLDRFRREILLAAGLQHPHIVGVVSAGDAEGLPYFVMPFVDGESLRVRIRSGPLPIPEAVHILRDVARALTYAHAQGVVHRDIKPDSVLLASGSATVADFGVAKALSSARLTPRQSDHTITSDGTSLGTPTYMAPEQAAADPATDHRADIYAFGVTAYEMVTGRLPFRADTPQELLAARLTERPRPPREERPDVPVALDRLIMACLEKRPADRPQSAAALLAALDNPEMTSGAHTAPSLPAARSRRWWAALGVAAVFGAAALYLGRRTTAAPPDPRTKRGRRSGESPESRSPRGPRPISPGRPRLTLRHLAGACMSRRCSSPRWNATARGCGFRCASYRRRMGCRCGATCSRATPKRCSMRGAS